MQSEEEARDAAIRVELSKIAKANPNAIPLYIILNTSLKEQGIEQPLTLCNKETLVKDMLLNLQKKYPKFDHIYFFGKEQRDSQAEESQAKSKRKRKDKTVVAEKKERILPIDEAMLPMTAQQIHGKYKDQHGLLVIIISSITLLPKKRQSFYEPFLLGLTVLFAAVFLYLSFSEEQPAKSGSEIDYIV